jgi:hypothetical protein
MSRVRGLSFRIALGSVALVSWALGAQPPPFTAEDMLAIQTFAGGQPVTLSRDGKWVAYVLTDLNDDHNVLEPRPTGHLHVQPLDGGAPMALTEGSVHGSFPIWSPDGRKLAFFRERDGAGRLALWDSETGRVAGLGEPIAGRSYLAPQWDRSGSRILYALAAQAEGSGDEPRVGVVRSRDQRIPGDDFFIDKRRARLGSLELRSLRLGNLKLVEGTRTELFDLIGDPSESMNVHQQNRAAGASLRAELADSREMARRRRDALRDP